MTTDDVKTEVIQLISELFEDKGFDINIIEYTNLIDDMGMDSITFISIVIEIEAKFNITVPDDMLLMDNFKKIDDIVTVVEQKLAKQSTWIRWDNTDVKTCGYA